MQDGPVMRWVPFLPIPRFSRAKPASVSDPPLNPRPVLRFASSTLLSAALNPSPLCSPNSFVHHRHKRSGKAIPTSNPRGSPSRMAPLLRPPPPRPHLRVLLRRLLSTAAAPSVMLPVRSPCPAATSQRFLLGPRYLLPLPTAAFARPPSLELPK
jgi:hypothetical protein